MKVNIIHMTIFDFSSLVLDDANKLKVTEYIL